MRQFYLVSLLIVALASGLLAEDEFLLSPKDWTGAFSLMFRDASILDEALFLAENADGRECLYLIREGALFKLRADIQRSFLRSGLLESKGLFEKVEGELSVADVQEWKSLFQRASIHEAKIEEAKAKLPEMSFSNYSVQQKGSSLDSELESLVSSTSRGKGILVDCDGTAEFALALLHKGVLDDFCFILSHAEGFSLYLLRRLDGDLRLFSPPKSLAQKSETLQQQLEELGPSGFEELRTVDGIEKKGLKILLE